MALPEKIANSPTLGKRLPLTTLNAELSEAGLSMKWEAAPPTSLHGAGQFHATIDEEVILCEGGESTTVVILKRGCEGTTKVSHAKGAQVWVVPTREAIENFVESFTTGENSVAIAYRKTAQNVAKAANTKIELDTVIKDPGGNFGAHPYYTVPATGYYQVNGQVAIVNLAAKSEMMALIYLSGVLTLKGTLVLQNEEGYCFSVVSGVIYCVAGERIELEVYNSGVEKALEVSPSENRLSVARVGSGPTGATGTTGATGPSGESHFTSVTLASSAALPAYEVKGEVLKATGVGSRLELDGESVTVGERVLIRKVTITEDDGVYEVVKQGKSGTEVWELKRTSDANTTAKLLNLAVFVQRGAINTNCVFVQTATVTTVGTTPQTWVAVKQPNEPWKSLVSLLENSWAMNVAEPQYMKDPMGFVHFRGRIKSGGGGGGNVFKLPPGYRPSPEWESSPIVCAGPTIGQLTAKSDGQVIIWAGSNSDVSLASVTYLAEN